MPALLRTALVLSVVVSSAPCVAEETTEVTVDKIKLNVPKSWKQEEASNALRLAQFRIPAAEGDAEPAELAISPPIGGTAKANIERWISQFDSSGRTVKMTKGTSSQGDYVFVELSGTYKKPDGPPVLGRTKSMPGYRMHGVILTVKGSGNLFLKLTGPDKTVAAQGEAMRTAIGAKTSDETEYKLD
jgi:hypothetical protein